MKVALYLSVLLFFILCTHQKGISQTAIHAENMTIPRVYSVDSQIYMCVQYTLAYSKRPRSKEKLKTICSCDQTLIRLIEWEKKYYSTPTTYVENTLIVWDKNFVTNYILPLIRDEDDKKRIEYTLVNSDKSTFKNIINYDNKVIVNDKMYYYPMNVKTCISVRFVNYEWFKSIVPKSSWIYNPDCFDDGEGMYINLLIPLLENDTVPSLLTPSLPQVFDLWEMK